MTILKNVEIWWPKLVQDRPEKKMNPDNPTWEIQIRTKDKNQRKEWVDNFINVTAVREDPEDDESPISYYRGNLKKKSLKLGKPAAPVSVTGGHGEELDPATIGNGSIGMIRLFPHEYTFEGKKGMTNTLMAIQITRLVKYVPKPMEEFEDTDMEVIEPEEGDTSEDDKY